ncbi:hypothetical protein L211DRAFT_234169 [Terfezia boudieri ATCC MYA-4762]|uniref:Uncharacterized protein n=1 Tax=Terfezia boudieri ATCC MYA-4762 TaxID=1051890 RepID=A0A3N4LSL2_9PEZI|nr:hypothetical protein L211DRAFT_234169 [Terfezia boudieri ATCC MYA-4762]
MSASTQQNLFTPPPMPTIPLNPGPTPTNAFTLPAVSPTPSKPSTSARASKALLTFPAFTDGNPFSIAAEEEVVMEVARCKAKAKAKAAWVRKQGKLREEWVVDVFRRTGRVPMCSWPRARREDGKVAAGVVDREAVEMGVKEDGEDGEEEEEKEKEKEKEKKKEK